MKNDKGRAAMTILHAHRNPRFTKFLPFAQSRANVQPQLNRRNEVS